MDLFFLLISTVNVVWFFFCYHLRIALFNLHNAAWSSILEPYTPHLLICFPLLSWRKCTCNVNVPLAMSAQLLFFFSKRLLNLTYIFLCHTLAHWRCCTHMISLFWLLIFFKENTYLLQDLWNDQTGQFMWVRHYMCVQQLLISNTLKLFIKATKTAFVFISSNIGRKLLFL